MRKGFCLTMKEDIELCVDFCPRDCIYMSHLDDGTPICYYAVINNECRRCKISECDKYKSGKPLKPKINNLWYSVYWEYEYYDEDADPVW